ncbi:MAG: M48 family metallopeptidase [Candidatus Hydrogenedentes bacterium]|nr:M48 family metallopeptidase [Candidatus Hydrogenedentota bacterium]
MWEQIRANQRKSVVVVLAMALLLGALGFFIGMAFFTAPSHPVYAEYPGHGPRTPQMDFTGGFLGLTIAMAVWFFMTLISYFAGANILLAASGARQIQKEDHPQLFNVVEEMSIAAGLPKMPDVYVMDDMAVNAFATGRDPRHAAVTVTAGLLGKLNRDQLQGVIAHEVGHIYNRDILFMQMLGVMAGSIVIIADTFTRSLWYSGGRRRSGRSSSEGGGGQGQAIMMVIAVVLAILAPILAQIIFLVASRRREYLADAQAAVFTRYPEGLASALEVISRDPVELSSVNRVTAPMYITNPLKGMSVAGLFSTHPPTEERIHILRNMGGNATFAEYQRAAQSVGESGALPVAALVGDKTVPIRGAHPDAVAAQDVRQQTRQVGDMLRAANHFTFVTCSCGVRMKIPPNFTQSQVQCPRCHATLAVPSN